VVKSCFLREIGITKMSAASTQIIRRRSVGGNVWLSHESANPDYLASLPVQQLKYEVAPSEEAVGLWMFDEIKRAAADKPGPLVIVILGGRGAQALHRLLGVIATDRKSVV